MKKEDIISSGLLEAYVLGKTSAEEISMIRRLCDEHPELLIEIEAIEASLMSYAAQMAPKPADAVKQRVFSQLQGSPVTTESSEARVLKLYKFGIAAGLLLFVTSMAYNMMLHSELKKLNGEIARLNEERSYLAGQMQVQQTSLTAMRQQMDVVTDPGVRAIALKGMNSMNNMGAMVYWKTGTNEVYFNAQVLPATPAGKQYQLWAIVDGKPVDAGMLQSGDSLFQKMKVMPGAQAFAVTIEKAGGSPTPTMETMCLLGKV